MNGERASDILDAVEWLIRSAKPSQAAVYVCDSPSDRPTAYLFGVRSSGMAFLQRLEPRILWLHLSWAPHFGNGATRVSRCGHQLS